ncbi:MAG: XRE family transcriptional regulator [Altererythrobacter sp. XM-24bin4]|nr:MAG: XRE family transcriptional regulator [Candidatus Aquiluna sp. XM-24bin5]PWL23922.1 MAG: XRE family transcriptional regulator [Altererythrobacter sp. XM-24bin4]
MDLIPGFLTTEDIKEKIARSVRARRIGMRFTQEELAARAGISLATLKRFEKRGDATFGVVLALAEALGVLDDFESLFPPVEARTLDELDQQNANKTRQRVRKRKNH